MSLIYKPIQSTIKNKAGEKTWHLSLVKTGNTVTTQTLGEKIAVISSLTPGDVHNAFRCLPIVMKEELLNGNSVKLEGLGTFTLKARTRGKGVATANDVNPSQITALNCLFTPEYTRMGDTITRSLTTGAQFVHVNRLKTGLVSNENGNNTGNGDDDDFIDPEA
mgnify:CR=1 FL=1